MNVYEAIKTRRSVRAYKQDPVPEESLKRILEAARLAPSGHNAQERKFIVVRDDEKRKQLAEDASGQAFISEAPVIIVAVALDPAHIMSSGVPSYAVDLAIAIDHMTLAAVEEGLDTCWIGAFSQSKVKEILDIPEECKVVVLLPLGFAKDELGPKTRKSMKEIICYDSFEK